MNQTLITDGQNLLDVVVQEYGGVEALFDLADGAGLSITDDLTAGQLLAVPTSAAARPEVVRYYQQRGQRVNTGAVAASPMVVVGDFSGDNFSTDDFLLSS